MIEHRALILAAGALCAITVGGILHAVGRAAAGDDVWLAAVGILAAELFIEAVHTIVVDHPHGCRHDCPCRDARRLYPRGATDLLMVQGPLRY